MAYLWTPYTSMPYHKNQFSAEFIIRPLRHTTTSVIAVTPNTSPYQIWQRFSLRKFIPVLFPCCVLLPRVFSQDILLTIPTYLQVEKFPTFKFAPLFSLTSSNLNRFFLFPLLEIYNLIYSSSYFDNKLPRCGLLQQFVVFSMGKENNCLGK